MKKLMMAAACAALIGSPAMAAPKMPKPVELSATELNVAQSRTYGLGFGTAFAATISTLQSLGYLNIQASKDAGTISGETETKAKAFYNILSGFGKKKSTQQASLLIEESSPGRTAVRLNLNVSQTKTRGFFGNSFKDGQLVRFSEPYAEFYAAMDAEVARRASNATLQSPVVRSSVAQTLTK